MTPELKEQLLVQAELFYTRAASIEPVAKDPMYVQAVAWRLDSLIMMGKIKRRLNRPAAVRSNPLFRCFFFFFFCSVHVFSKTALAGLLGGVRGGSGTQRAVSGARRQEVTAG